MLLFFKYNCFYTPFNHVLTHLFPMHLFCTLLKTSENLAIFRCVQGVEKGCIGDKWINATLPSVTHLSRVLTA